MKKKGGQRGPSPATTTKACPCGSGAAYDACCAPFHEGEREAPDPVSLMRSRYAAFTLGLAEYLVRTLAEAHPDLATPRPELLRSLRGAKDRLRYRSLTILDERRSGRTGEVLFCARIQEGAADVSFVELSDFEHDGTGWRYASGILVPLKALGQAVEGLGIDAFLAIAAAR